MDLDDTTPEWRQTCTNPEHTPHHRRLAGEPLIKCLAPPGLGFCRPGGPILRGQRCLWPSTDQTVTPAHITTKPPARRKKIPATCAGCGREFKSGPGKAGHLRWHKECAETPDGNRPKSPDYGRVTDRLTSVLTDATNSGVPTSDLNEFHRELSRLCDGLAEKPKVAQERKRRETRAKELRNIIRQAESELARIREPQLIGEK